MTEAEAKPKPARSAWPIVGIVLIALLVLTIIGGGIGVSWYNAETPKVAARKYNTYPFQTVAPPRPGAAQQPTAGLDADADTTADVRAFLVRFGKALPTKNLEAQPWLDLESVRGEAFYHTWALPVKPSPNPQFQPDEPEEAGPNTDSLAMAQVWHSCRRTWRTWNWAEMIVSRVTALAPVDFHVYTQFPQPDGSRIKIRWRLVYQPATRTYAINHWMDLKTGWESVHEAAAALASHHFSDVRNRPIWAMRGIAEAHAAMDEGKTEEARRALDGVARSRPGPRWDDLYELAEARYSQFDFDDDDAADRIEARVDQNTVQLPALALLIQSLRYRNERERIPDLVRRYQAIAGPDADVLAAAGVAAVSGNQSEEAREYFEQALKVHPENAAALLGMLRLTPELQKPAFVERIARLKAFPKLFPKLAEGAWYDEWKSLENLAQAHRKATGDETAARFVVRAQLNQDKSDEAKTTFRTAAEKLTGVARASLLADFLSTSHGKKGGRMAYDAVDQRDRREAFRSVMSVWEFGVEEYAENPTPEQRKVRDENRARFDKLLDDHTKNDPDDPLLLVYRSVSANIRADYKLAEASAAAYLERFPATGKPEDDYKTRAELAKRQWFIAMIRLNRAPQAAERYPDDASFQSLGFECLRAELPEPLNALIRLREKQSPPAADPAYWRGEFHRLKKEHRRAAQEFLAYLNNRETGEYAPHEYQARDRLVRAWMKTGNADDAIEFLKAEKEPQPLLTALALTAKSNEEAEAYLLDAIAKQAWVAFQMYRDPDLGPLLKGPDFARLRKKHPEPPAGEPDE